MKKILAILVASLGLMACQGCVKDKTTQPITPVVSVDPVDQKITFDKMTVTIPIAWIKLGEGKNIVAYASSHKKFKVMMTKETCPNVAICMLSALQSIQEAGATIETVSSSFGKYGKELVVVSSMNGVKIYSWFITKEDSVYMLACGGESGVQGKTICDAIHDSVILQ